MGKKGRLLKEQTAKGVRPLKRDNEIKPKLDTKCLGCGAVFPKYRAEEHVKACEGVKRLQVLRMQMAEKLRRLGVRK